MNLTNGGSKWKTDWNSLLDFWWEVFLALQRVIAFFLFAGIHRFCLVVLDWSLNLPNWPQAQQFAHQVSYAFFLALTAFLGYDMLAVFIPFLRGKKWSET